MVAVCLNTVRGSWGGGGSHSGTAAAAAGGTPYNLAVPPLFDVSACLCVSVGKASAATATAAVTTSAMPGGRGAQLNGSPKQPHSAAPAPTPSAAVYTTSHPLPPALHSSSFLIHSTLS